MRRKKSSVLRRRSASELKRLRAAFAAAFERQLGRVPLLFFFFSFPFFSFLAYVSEHADGEQRGALADLNLPNDASRRDLSRPPLRSIPSLGVCCPHASSKKKVKNLCSAYRVLTVCAAKGPTADAARLEILAQVHWKLAQLHASGGALHFEPAATAEDERREPATDDAAEAEAEAEAGLTALRGTVPPNFSLPDVAWANTT